MEDVEDEEMEEDEELEEEEDEEEEYNLRMFGIQAALPVPDGEPDWESGVGAGFRGTGTLACGPLGISAALLSPASGAPVPAPICACAHSSLCCLTLQGSPRRQRST